jgi:endogenous inhibitor of DNA gyrase (YacG/DUF329 family)
MSAAKPRPCPICRKPAGERFAPFCSARCRDRDLARWLNDGYALPGPPAEPEDLPSEPPEE